MEQRSFVAFRAMALWNPENGTCPRLSGDKFLGWGCTRCPLSATNVKQLQTIRDAAKLANFAKI